MKKSVLILMVLCVSLVTPLFSGGGQETEGGVTSVRVALWDENQKPSIQRALDEFNASQDAIHAVIELTPWTNYWTKLDASLGAGTAPDIFWMNVYIPKYADGDVVESLDSWIAESGVDMSLYTPSTTGIYNYKGRQWGLPKGVDSVAVAYNKDFFDRAGLAYPEAGWTWEDMVRAADAMKGSLEKGSYPLVMELDAQPSYYNFIFQQGGFVVDSAYTEAGFDKPEAKAAYQRVLDLMHGGQMAPYEVLSETKGTDIFVSGRAGMVFVGSWKAPVMENSELGKNGRIGIVTMPVNGKNNFSVQGGLGYAMAKSSKNKEAAWEVMRFLCGERGNQIQAEDGIDIPALISQQKVYKTNFTNIDVQAYFDASETGVPYPYGPYGPQYSSEVGSISSKIFAELVSVEDGCHEIDEMIETVFKEGN